MKKVLMFITLLSIFLLVGCKGKEYVVSFVSNSATTNTSLESGSVVKFPELTNLGYDLVGWYYDAEYHNMYQNEPIESDVTFYAKWEISKYKVKFVVDGIVISEQTIEYKKDAVLPDNPVKEGYIFVGWDKGNIEITKDLEINALFEEKMHNVSFLVFGEEIKKISVKNGDKVTPPSAPDKEGYIFEKWDKSIDTITSDLVINAVYKKITYEVIFNVDGKEYQKQQVEYGESAITPNEPTKEGYKFVGWDNDYANVKENMTIEAVFEENKYLVKFFVDGKVVSEQSLKKGEVVNVPENPVKEGYEFIGWDQDYSSIVSDLVINAIFERKTFKVVYYVDGEVFDEETVNYGEKALCSKTPEKEYYTFISWDKESDEVKSDLILNAVFEKTSFIVKFIVDGETIDTQVVKKGESAVEPFYPDIEGYTFDRWNKDFTEVKEDLEITGLYEINLYAITYFVDGHEYGLSDEVEYGKDAVLPANPTKEGYTFVKWDKELTNIKEDIETNAVFSIIEYSIKYFENDVEKTYPITKYTIEDTKELPLLTKENYVFAGWFDSNHLSGSFFDIPEGTTGDLELHASFVKIDLNGGSYSWSINTVSNPDNGISSISNLPEIFEYDFFTYLKDNNLLESSLINKDLQATTWEKFSGINPLHNNDPKRIWNDTSTNSSKGADGYTAVFLFDTVEVDTDGNLIDVKGGFLGTEPYKSKYFNLLNSLGLMHKFKEENNDYTAFSVNTNAGKALTGFVIDGYFYGTQGKGSGYFLSLRSVIPTTAKKYTVSGTNAVAKTTEYVYTSMPCGLTNALVHPFKDGYAFIGWFTDQECKTKLTNDAVIDGMTIYAGYELIE